MPAIDYAGVDKWQKESQEVLRQTPEGGAEVMFCGKKLIVLRGVFRPFRDSEALIDEIKILPGETALDVCTGSGCLAVIAAYKGAKKVVAIDLNPVSVECTQRNAKLRGFEGVIEARQGDVLAPLKEGEKFDVVIINPPFRNKEAKDLVEGTQWDSNLSVHKKFFLGIRGHLKKSGRIYFFQSDFGAVNEMKQMAADTGFHVRLLKEKKVSFGPGTFYLFELTLE